MGKQIIRQPNGRYAIFSTGTDTIHMWDATADEVVEHFVERAVEDARREWRRIVECVAAGEPRRVYYQFTMTWEEALELDREHGGEVWRAVMNGEMDPV
jgi:hypothetical protein